MRFARIMFGIALSAAAFLPASYAYGLSFWLLPGGPIAPNQHAESWSLGFITLHGWQMYGGLVLFTVIALLMLAGGVYLICSKPGDD
jgi:hypothetical protein